MSAPQQPSTLKQEQVAIASVITVLARTLISNGLVPRDQLEQRLAELRSQLHGHGHEHGSRIVGTLLDQIRAPGAPTPPSATVLKFPDPE